MRGDVKSSTPGLICTGGAQLATPVPATSSSSCWFRLRWRSRLAAGAAARRTQSSFSTFLASTNPSNMFLVPPPPAGVPNSRRRLEGRLAALADVRHVESALFYVTATPRAPTGRRSHVPLQATPTPHFGSVSSASAPGTSAVISGRIAESSRGRRGRDAAGAARKLHLGAGVAFRSAWIHGGPAGQNASSPRRCVPSSRSTPASLG